MTDRHQRLTMGCGWEPESERLDVISPPLGFPETDECPGYLIRLPEVEDAARALSWLKKSSLDIYLDGNEMTPLATDCVDILDCEIHEVEAHALRVAREGK